MIPEWFADLNYSSEGKLIITKLSSLPVCPPVSHPSLFYVRPSPLHLFRKHDPVPLNVVKDRVNALLGEKKITTVDGFVPLPEDVAEVSICCHSDTPVRILS